MTTVTIRRCVGAALAGAVTLGVAACAAGNDGAGARSSASVVADPSITLPQPTALSSSGTASPNAPVATQCPDGFLTIDTDGASIAVVGECTGITVEANKVTVIADQVNSVEVKGDYCTVTVGETDWINVNGNDNIVTSTGTGSVAVDGNRNAITVPTRSSVTFHEGATDNSFSGLGENCTLVNNGEGNTAVAGGGALPTVS